MASYLEVSQTDVSINDIESSEGVLLGANCSAVLHASDSYTRKVLTYTHLNMDIHIYMWIYIYTYVRIFMQTTELRMFAYIYTNTYFGYTHLDI